MVGILDSGTGGENTARELRRLGSSADVLLYLDREHAPYGERSEEELIPLIERGIETLKERGAKRVLLACCTASSAYARLSPSAREISIPIIEPIARHALRVSRGGKIVLMATERTILSGEFSRLLGDRLALSIPAPQLVRLIDGGARDGCSTQEVKEYLEELLSPMKELEASVLILGCTHFSSLALKIRQTLAELTKNKILIADSAKISAMALIESEAKLTGVGQIIRI